MKGIVARIRVKEGKGEEFEQVAKDLVEATSANEPGNKSYRLHRSEDGRTYVFTELYADQDAIGAHTQSPHFRALFPKLAALADGEPEIEILDWVAGM